MYEMLQTNSENKIIFITKPVKRTIILNERIVFEEEGRCFVEEEGRYFLSFPSIIFCVEKYRNRFLKNDIQFKCAFVINNKKYLIPLTNIDFTYLCIGKTKEFLYENLNLINDNKDLFIKNFLDLFWQTEYNCDITYNLCNLFSKGFSLTEWERKTKENKDYVIEEKYCTLTNDKELVNINV